MLGYVEFTELLGNRKSRNGGLLIHMSQVRVLPGEPVFPIVFHALLAVVQAGPVLFFKCSIRFLPSTVGFDWRDKI